VENRWIFGDFPGYGYAKVSKEQKKEFERLVRKFLKNKNFQGAIQIVDSRHPNMETDLMLNAWLDAQKLPHVIVLNKSDKLNQKERAEAGREARDAFPGQPVLFVSTVTKEGRHSLIKAIRDFI
jgi:GTP-binding protein